MEAVVGCQLTVICRTVEKEPSFRNFCNGMEDIRNPINGLRSRDFGYIAVSELLWKRRVLLVDTVVGCL